MNNQDQKRNLVSTLSREKVDADFSNKSASRYLSIHTIVQSLSLSLSHDSPSSLICNGWQITLLLLLLLRIGTHLFAERHVRDFQTCNGAHTNVENRQEKQNCDQTHKDA